MWLLCWIYSFLQAETSSNIIPNSLVCLILGRSCIQYTIYSESNFRFIVKDCYWKKKRTAHTAGMLSAEQLSIYERLIDVVFLEVNISCLICDITLNLFTFCLSLKKTQLENTYGIWSLRSINLYCENILILNVPWFCIISRGLFKLLF
jgi:hypothetical protein